MTRGNGALSVLIVEDEALLAMDIASIIEDAGHHVVGEVASLREFCELRLATPPDLAFVDIQLAEGSNGIDVSASMRALWPETMIVFITANPGKVPADCPGPHGIISKPFSRQGLTAALHFIGEGIRQPPPILPTPGNFRASPQLVTDWQL